MLVTMCFSGSKFAIALIPCIVFALVTIAEMLTILNEFISGKSGEPGPGTGPIKNPQTGVDGYEDSKGVYHDGKDPNETGSS